jgi:hypothetical protein
VTLAFVPADVTPQQLAGIGMAPGVMSAGMGGVPGEQTLLDITQGNRVFDSLYDSDLPPMGPDCAVWEEAVEERARSAPADIEPGLLYRVLLEHGVAVFNGTRTPRCGPETIEARSGRGGISSGVFEMVDARLRDLSSHVRSLPRRDLLIAIARPTGDSDAPLAIGIAGRGLHGSLTSDSTRTDGYVLSTDVAPTILRHFGIDVPSEMSGEPIRSDGAVDPAAIESLAARMDVISSRRGPVIGLSLLAWALALAAAVLAGRGRGARAAVRMAALSVVYLPLLLLLGAAVEPGQTAEALLVAIGSPMLAALTLPAVGGYRALAVASAATVLFCAVDVIAGSPLTKLSLLGPNPGLGVRFYGIGNELEAVLAVLVVAGTGAALSGFAPRLSPRRCAAAFLAVGIPLAFVFAAGRFGADVGAAIVLPLGAAGAAAAVTDGRRRALPAALAAPLAAVALLALIDLVSGANAHLTRSVLDAGGLSDLGDVAQRRLQLSAHSFARPVVFVFMPLVAVGGVLALRHRRRIAVWLAGLPAMRAGLLGALAATIVGTLANDSGALLLEIGAVYVTVFTAYAWAESRPPERTG